MDGRVAVLFWFYRDLPVCRNRLDLLRRDNPDASIFGLYGGDPLDAERFRLALEPDLDDFWAFDQPVSSKWKWLNGDLMLAAWYEARAEARMGSRLRREVGPPRPPAHGRARQAARDRRSALVGRPAGRGRRTRVGVVEGRARARVSRGSWPPSTRRSGPSNPSRVCS